MVAPTRSASGVRESGEEKPTNGEQCPREARARPSVQSEGTRESSIRVPSTHTTRRLDRSSRIPRRAVLLWFANFEARVNSADATLSFADFKPTPPSGTAGRDATVSLAETPARVQVPSARPTPRPSARPKPAPAAQGKTLFGLPAVIDASAS